MEKLTFSNENIYSQELEKFKVSKLKARLEEKYRIRPFYEQEKLKRNLVLVGSYFLNTFSICTGLLFIASLLELNIWLSGAFALFLLGFLEGLKRMTLAPIGKNYYQFSKIKYVPILFGCLLIASSALFSYKGAGLAVRQFSVSPILIDADSIKSAYNSKIEALKAQQADLMKVQYKGTTTRTAIKTVKQLQEEVMALQTQSINDIDNAVAENKNILTDSNTIRGDKALYFAMLALILDIFLVISIFYLEYYDFRSLAEFAEIPQKATQGTAQGTAAMPLGSASCDHCNSDFEKRAHNQKFCCEKCRIEAYEDRTGKKLKYKPKE